LLTKITNSLLLWSCSQHSRTNVSQWYEGSRC